MSAGRPTLSQGPDAESLAARAAACCRSEPECVLCPLLPANAGVPVAELVRRGLNVKVPLRE